MALAFSWYTYKNMPPTGSQSSPVNPFAPKGNVQPAANPPANLPTQPTQPTQSGMPPVRPVYSPVSVPPRPPMPPSAVVPPVPAAPPIPPSTPTPASVSKIFANPPAATSQQPSTLRAFFTMPTSPSAVKTPPVPPVATQATPTPSPSARPPFSPPSSIFQTQKSEVPRVPFSSFSSQTPQVEKPKVPAPEVPKIEQKSVSAPQVPPRMEFNYQPITPSSPLARTPSAPAFSNSPLNSFIKQQETKVGSFNPSAAAMVRGAQVAPSKDASIRSRKLLWAAFILILFVVVSGVLYVRGKAIYTQINQTVSR